MRRNGNWSSGGADEEEDEEEGDEEDEWGDEGDGPAEGCGIGDEDEGYVD